MPSVKTGPLLVSIVVVLIGVLALFGAVPQLRVICTGTCLTEKAVVANFGVTSTNLTAELRDFSTGVEAGNPAPYLISHIAVTWGDGTPTQSIVRGSTDFHTYAAYKTYDITEKVWGDFAPTTNYTNTSSFSTSITLTPSNSSSLFSLTASMRVNQNDTSVSVLDETTSTNVSTIVITVAWGDGANNTTKVGGVVAHTYVMPKNGTNATYTISDTATGIGPKGLVSAQVTQSITVYGTNSTKYPVCVSDPLSCVPTPPPTPPSHGLFYLNALSLGLMAFGSLGVLMTLIAGNVVYRVALILVGGTIVTIVGLFLGGL